MTKGLLNFDFGWCKHNGIPGACSGPLVRNNTELLVRTVAVALDEPFLTSVTSEFGEMLFFEANAQSC